MESVRKPVQHFSIQSSEPGSQKLSDHELSKLSDDELMKIIFEYREDTAYILPILFKLVEKDHFKATRWINDLCKDAYRKPESAQKIFDCCMQGFREGSAIAWFLAEYLCKNKLISAQHIGIAEMEFAQKDKQQVATEMYVSGNAHYLGNGVEQSYSEAHTCYMKAHFLGHGSAMLSLAVMNKCGEHVAKDIDRAGEFLSKAPKAPISVNLSDVVATFGEEKMELL